MGVSVSAVEGDLEVAADPAKPSIKRRLKADAIKPGQFLLNKVQLLELCGNPSYSTVWGWMMTAGFPPPIELGPPGGRTSLVAWIASEVFAWLKARPRRAIGNLKQHRAAQEKRKPARGDHRSAPMQLRNSRNAARKPHGDVT